MFKSLNSATDCRILLKCSYASARWVPGAGLLTKADWRDGRPQVAMQRQLPPFLFITDTADKSDAVAITLWVRYADITSH